MRHFPRFCAFQMFALHASYGVLTLHPPYYDV